MSQLDDKGMTKPVLDRDVAGPRQNTEPDSSPVVRGQICRWRAQATSTINSNCRSAFSSTNVFAFPPAKAETLLQRILALDGDSCWSLLSPFFTSVVHRYLYDATDVPKGVPNMLGMCLEKLLIAPEFGNSSYRAGELHGFDLPQLARTIMFVSVERAMLAARYVNGDWSDIALILPLVDRYLRAVGWSSTVMCDFLTLCERSGASYPAGQFADQILSVLDGTAS